ncbi:hypothetical protein ACFFMM_11460 [Micromonospora chaiyaphumensis]|uniref:Uncharacterized protein n=1 Tax=Micromonospora chaiyaphumensis TaxID=307119 RepID=A0A1C4W8F4_9ACTN|nr:hypothetical protein [Micromonospora chaiyaphumensis]SCE92506.1 hypothetical protein GA0070214_103330 [Micromonospora chaiyaphumensis]
MQLPHRHAVPDAVNDILLWLLATDVAAAHQAEPGQPDRCANLRCAGHRYPCPPARDAHRACQAATRPAPPTLGRARVVVPTARFAGWFRPARLQPTASPRAA